MEREKPDYLSYLLRLWCAYDGATPAWRAMLKSTRSCEEIGFASLEALFDYLRSISASGPDQKEESDNHGCLD